MGTNFYLLTKNKKIAEQWSPRGATLTDFPDFGYEIHIAKTSAGWLPLFQCHEDTLSSVKDYKKAYDTGAFNIYDEYGNEYDWATFTERVLNFNGGVAGKLPAKSVPRNTIDPNMPNTVPVSHFDYGNGKYADHYYKDSEGYEFTGGDFC